jgi:hypothetical protein
MPEELTVTPRPKEIENHKKWKEILKKGKRGKFVIQNNLVQGFPCFVKDILNDLLIVRAEWRLDVDGMEYVAFGEYFDETPYGEYPKEYGITLIMGKINLGEGEPEYGPIDWKIVPFAEAEVKHETTENERA